MDIIYQQLKHTSECGRETTWEDRKACERQFFYRIVFEKKEKGKK